MDKQTLETAKKLDTSISDLKSGLEDVEYILNQSTEEKKREVYQITLHEMPDGAYSEKDLTTTVFFNYIGRDFYKYLEWYKEELEKQIADLEKRLETL